MKKKWIYILGFVAIAAAISSLKPNKYAAYNYP